MSQYDAKSGGFQPTYDEIRDSRGPGRPAQTTMPWWNPRYWPKLAWALIVGVIVVIAIVVGAVVGTQAKKNAYPDYSELSYSLAETCTLPPGRACY